MPTFVDSKRLNLFITDELRDVLKPIVFRGKRGTLRGYKAEALPLVCPVGRFCSFSLMFCPLDIVVKISYITRCGRHSGRLPLEDHLLGLRISADSNTVAALLAESRAAWVAHTARARGHEDTMTDATAPKTRTIILTDRRPVTILEHDWPLIAKATGGPGPLHTYRLMVRQHADGRTLVYGVLDGATADADHPTYRGGVLLANDSQLIRAIHRVGASCHLPESIIAECIADLPAEVI